MNDKEREKEAEIGSKAIQFINEHEKDCLSDFEMMRKFAFELTKNYEKRITELEIVNKRISTECYKLVDTLEKKQKDIVDLEKENEQLEQQIEQMKCCEICAYGGNDFGICYSNKPCKNKNQWKLTNWVKREIKEND